MRRAREGEDGKKNRIGRGERTRKYEDKGEQKEEIRMMKKARTGRVKKT